MNTSQKLTGDQFSEDLIYEQLQKIFLCPAFAVSEILQRFLTYISEEALAGRSNTIKEYTIAVNVLNKPISFKPQHDAIVRIHAGRLRRALHYYYKELGKEDKIEISVPKGSYVPVFENREGSTYNRPLDLLQQRNTPAKLRLVILPFSTLETEMSRLVFADSLGHQLSAGLGIYSDFSIVSYYTTKRLNFQRREIQSLISEFGVRFVITGNVLFENRKLKVFTQLTDTASGTQIWSVCYSQSFSDSGLLDVADQITSQMLNTLGDFNGLIIREISKERNLRTLIPSYASPLVSYYDFFTNFNESSFKKSYAYAESVIEADPYNDVAWSFLGQLNLLGDFFNKHNRENAEGLSLRYARRAIKINPSSQHGYLSLAMAHLFLENKQSCLEALVIARRLNPHVTGLKGIMGCVMICAGDYDQGVQTLKESMELNKYFPPFFYFFTSLYYYKQGHFSKALAELEKSGLVGDPAQVLMRISILVQMGRKSEASALVKSLKSYTLHRIWATREFINKILLDTELLDQLNYGFKTIRLPLLTVA